MTTKQEPRIGVSGATDMNATPHKPTLWQHILTVLKNIKKDFLQLLILLEFLSFVGTLVFVAAAVNLFLRNEPLQLNLAGAIAVLLCGLGVMLSFLQGYWEHLLKRDEEWER